LTDLERRAASLDQLRRDTANLPRAIDLAKAEVKNGIDPKYVALKYQLGPDFIAACEIWKQSQERKRERTESESSDSASPESR
jgi:hypothetical protein